MELLKWFFIWFLFWGSFNGFVRWQFEKQKRLIYILNWFFYAIIAVPLYFIFDNPLFNINQFLYGYLFCITIGAILDHLPQYNKRIIKGKNFLEFHSSNLLLQQIFIVSGIFILSNYLGLEYKNFHFGVMFTLGHIPIILLKWVKLKYLYLLWTLVAGTLFSYLIINYEFGIFISTAIHCLSYTFLLYYLKNADKI